MAHSLPTRVFDATAYPARETWAHFMLRWMIEHASSEHQCVFLVEDATGPGVERHLESIRVTKYRGVEPHAIMKSRRGVHFVEWAEQTVDSFVQGTAELFDGAGRLFVLIGPWQGIVTLKQMGERSCRVAVQSIGEPLRGKLRDEWEDTRPVVDVESSVDAQWIEYTWEKVHTAGSPATPPWRRPRVVLNIVAAIVIAIPLIPLAMLLHFGRFVWNTASRIGRPKRIRRDCDEA